MLRLCSHLTRPSTATTAAVSMRSVRTLAAVRVSHMRHFSSTPFVAATASASVDVAAAAAATSTVSVTAATPAVAATATTTASPAASARPQVRSAQLRAQRPRATTKSAAASNPDSSLVADKCGPVVVGQDEPEMVNVVNAVTGERMGPRGLEPTRYGDWEAKGRCWDF